MRSPKGRRGVLGVDTNLLVRFLVRDDARSAAVAERFFTERLSRANPGFINLIVLSEIVWVLGRSYSYRKPEIAEVIGRILNAGEFVVENAQGVETALELYRTTSIDFADALIVVHNRKQGCTATYTFDKTLSASGLAGAL